MAYDPIVDLERLGVPARDFKRNVRDVLATLSQSEAEAFASIWHKANTAHLNDQVTDTGGAKMRAWIWGKSGY